MFPHQTAIHLEDHADDVTIYMGCWQSPDMIYRNLEMCIVDLFLIGDDSMFKEMGIEGEVLLIK